MSEGWFKTRRGITKHPLLKGHPERLAIWIWLLDNVAWADTTQDVLGLEVVVPRGHLLAAQRRIAEELGVGRQVVRTFFDLLEREGMISVNRPTHADGHGGNPARTMLKVNNWDRYQLKGSSTNPADGPAANPQNKNPPYTDREVPVSTVTPSLSPAAQKTDADPEQKPKKVKPKAERFQEFWDSAYPHREKKIARGKCEAKYKALVASGVDEEAIIGGARAYARTETVRKGIVCNPMTWLNNRRWEDETAEIIPHPATHRTPAHGKRTFGTKILDLANRYAVEDGDAQPGVAGGEDRDPSRAILPRG